MRAPLRRFGTRTGFTAAVTDDRAASHEVRCSSGCCVRSAAGVHWVPRTRLALAVSDGAGGFHRSPSAARLRLRLHPLVSFAPLQSPPFRVRRRCLHRQLLPWGSRSLIATSPGSVRAPRLPALGAFPSSAFLTPPTVSATTRLVGLFHPTATSRVRSTGAFPRKQPRRLVDVASHALSPVVRRSADDVATAATNRRPALRALFRSRIRYRRFSY
jgi:hypothetical protein